MSNAMLTLCMPVQLPSTEKLLLLVLADAASDNGHLWQLVSTICIKMCLSDRVVQRALSSLEARGYVRRELRAGRSSVFYLIPEAIAASVSPQHKLACNPSSRFASMVDGDAGVTTRGHDPRCRRHHPPVPASPPPGAGVTHNPFLTLSEPKTVVRDRFTDFWAEYPNGASKVAARKRWDQLIRDGVLPNDEAIALLMASLAQHKRTEQWTKDGGRFVPHAATWLHQQRWRDEIKATVADSPAIRRCQACGAQATVFAEGGWFCRADNPNRGAATRRPVQGAAG